MKIKTMTVVLISVVLAVSCAQIPATGGEPVTCKPYVVTQAQLIDNSTVTIPEVFNDGPGWLVIHADADGTPGKVIGFASVHAGLNPNVSVIIDETLATETLFAMLHEDLGEVGVNEFPGPDVPVSVDNAMVNVPFLVTKDGAGVPY